MELSPADIAVFLAELDHYNALYPTQSPVDGDNEPPAVPGAARC